MATTTTYLSLRKPETSDTVSVTTDISNNMDLIDAIMTPATPQNQAVGDSASAGSNATVAKSDHKHGMPNFGAPANIASASSNGVATTIARADHVHAITAGTIVNADVSATAEIAVSKLADGAANEVVVTASDGVSVQWAQISDAHVSNTAEIAVSKLADGAAYEVVATASDGTSVAWAALDNNHLSGFTYTAFTPTVAQSGAVTVTTNVARYRIFGKFIHAYFKLTCTSAGTGGNDIVVTLPAALTASASAVTGQYVGVGTVDDVGTATYRCIVWMPSTTTVSFVATNNTSGTVGTTPNFSLASNDVLYANLYYEVA